MSTGPIFSPGMPIIIPAWDIGILSIKRSSQNQFNECRCPPLMMKSRAHHPADGVAKKLETGLPQGIPSLHWRI